MRERDTRGQSPKDVNEVLAITLLAAMRLRCGIWFEWVDSGANWSDGISREFDKDPAFRRLGFKTRPIVKDTARWTKTWTEKWDTAIQIARKSPHRPQGERLTREQALEKV